MIDLFTTSGIIGDSLLNMLNGICLFIDSIVYWFISLLYQVFISISQVNLFNESTQRTIIDRVFTILGVLMLFIMAYQIILLIINPDKLSGDNGAKKLVTKVITSIVLIVLLPTIFKYMQIFQYDVLTSNVIGNVVLGGSSANSDYDIKSAGTSMALTIASAFFHPVDEGKEYSYIACKQLGTEAPGSCETYIEVYDQCLENNDPGALFMNSELQGLLNLNLWESFWGSERQMKYIPIISTIAAILALRMIIAFCLDIGVRVAKLGFLQVVAPIPIALNINAKESIFGTKWFKSLKDTYLDIFMKLIIIYFSMFAISMVPEVLSNLWAGDGNFLVQILATVAVILGILQFAKDGPKLIKDLFNMEFDFSIEKRLNENTYAMRGASVLSGGLSSLASNVYDGVKNKKGALNTTLSGMGGLFGGARRGWKNSEGIDNINKIGGVVDKTRAESDAARARGDDLRQRGLDADYGTEDGRVVPGVTRLAGMTTKVPDKLQEVKQNVQDWFDSGVSSEKLNAAKGMASMFDTLFNNFTNSSVKGIEAAQQQALKDFQNGKEVKGIKSVTKDATGKFIESVQDLAKPDMDAIKKYYEHQKQKEFTKSFNKSINAQSIKQYGNQIVREMSSSLAKLGPDAQKMVLKEAGFSELSELQEVFNVVGDATKFTDKEMDQLRQISNALGDQVKAQSLQQQAAAAKDKKE